MDTSGIGDEVIVAVTTAAITGPLGWLAKTATQRLRARRPLDTFVEQDTSIVYGTIPDWASFPYYFDCDPDQLPQDPPANGVEWWSWAMANHGVPAIHSEIAITLLPRADVTVVVDRFRVQHIEASPAPPGCLVVHPVGGASIVHRQANIKLIGPMAPIVSFLEMGSAEIRSGFTFALGSGEPARLAVTARAVEPEFMYKWIGSLDMIVQGRRRSVTISAGGRPFVLHGGANCSEFEYRNDQWYPSHYYPTSAQH